MASEYLKDFNNMITVQLSRLLKSYLSITPEDKKYNEYLSYSKKYLNDNSMLYILRKKDVEAKLESLTEKLEINSQFDKAKLLNCYVNRLKGIFENKKPVVKDNLWSYINLVLQLCHSPLVNIVNVEEMKENFESKYVKDRYEKFIKNKNYVDKDVEEDEINLREKLEIPFVDYNEKTPTWSEDEDYAERMDIVKEEPAKEEKVEAPLEEEKEEIKPKQYSKKEIIEMKKQYLFKNLKKLFTNKDYYGNMNKIFFDHLLNLNLRMNQTFKVQIPYKADGDYILNLVMHSFTYWSKEEIDNQNYFINKFAQISPVEFSIQLQDNLIKEINTKRNDINFLRQLSLVFTHHNIETVVHTKFLSIVDEFVMTHDIVINQLLKLLYYQKGKIENFNIEKILFIHDIEKKTSFNFTQNLLKKTNTFIEKFLQKKPKIKFTLLKFILFYTKSLTPQVEFFKNVIKKTIAIKNEFSKKNRSTNCLLVKGTIDMIYNSSKSNSLAVEVLLSLLDSYSRFIFEFIINGNLIDINNEFFIDHLLVKKENKKLIFCFNEKFSIFNWVDCFKVKSFNLNENQESVCVPIPLMINNTHFKVLETAKTTFLLKNLNVINFFDNLNKDCLLSIASDKEKNIVKKINDENENVNEQFNELNKLNNDLQIKKEEIKQVERELFKFQFIDGYSEEIDTVKNAPLIESEILDFTQSQAKKEITKSIFKKEDVEMEDFSINNTNEKNKPDLTISFSNTSSSPELNQIVSMLKADKSKEELDLYQIDTTSCYNIDLIISSYLLSKIVTINKIINTKFLDILLNKLHVEDNFSLVFSVYLFEAGFSMNKFVHEINEYLTRSTTSHVSTENNFFLKNLLITLSTTSTDLMKYKAEVESDFTIAFNDIDSFMYHSHEDLISLSYHPKLPMAIFFDNNLMMSYNVVFNFILKLKRSFLSIRDIKLDKALKLTLLTNEGDFQKRTVKNLIVYRMMILDFIANYEFFIFNMVIAPSIAKFKSTMPSLTSIDKFISTHKRFINDIITQLGLREGKFIKKVYKLLNMIVSFAPLLNRYQVNTNDPKTFFIEVNNTSEKFKKKMGKVNEFIGKLKEANINK